MTSATKVGARWSRAGFVLRWSTCMSFRPFITRGAARTARTLASRCRPNHRLYATEATHLADIALKPTIYGQPLAPSHPHLCAFITGCSANGGT